MKEKRIIHTCFGEMEIQQVGNDVFALHETDGIWPLPMPNMTNDEIKDYFRILKENEE